MKQPLFMLFILLLSGTVSAQVQPDSILFFNQSRREFEATLIDATQLSQSAYDKVNQATLSYSINTGHFRQAQEAEHNKSLHFNTSGIQQLGKFKFAGSFNFDRLWEDSLAYSLKGMPGDNSPYYYMAAKAGNVKRLNYALNGTGTYELLPGKLFLAGGINYMYNTSARSVDPRSISTTYAIKASPGIIYQWHRQALGLTGSLGYGTETNNFGYLNNTYANSNLFPDRFTYLVQGYGYSNRINDPRQFKKKTDYQGLQLSYTTNYTAGYLKTNVQYLSINDDNYYELTRSENNRTFGRYKLNTYQFFLLSALTGSRYQQQLQLTAAYDNGYDTNLTLGGSNYKYERTAAELIYTIRPSKSAVSLLPELALNLNYNRIYQKDISANNQTDYNYLQPGISTTLYKLWPDGNKFSVTAAPAVRLSLRQSIRTQPGLFDYFTSGIIYPDYIYYSSTAGIIQTHLQFTTPQWFKGTTAAIQAHVTYAKPMLSDTERFITTFTPNGSRLTATLSFGLYF